MGCNCGGSKPRGSRVTGFKVTLSNGEKLGPFLTAMEARFAVTAAGGGVVTPIRETIQ